MQAALAQCLTQLPSSLHNIIGGYVDPVSPEFMQAVEALQPYGVFSKVCSS